LVGIHDNFFDLGGHSLLAVHLLAHIEKAFGRHLPLATLFQGPTVEQLAEQLYQEERPMSWSWLVPIQPKGSKPPFFCMHGGSGVAHYLGPDQPYYGLQPHGLDGRRVPTTIEDMAIDYIKEIRTVQPEGPYFLGGYSYGGLVAFEMAQQLRHQGQEVALLVLFDTSLPKMSNVSSIMDSDTAPLFSALARYRSKFSRHLMNLRPFGPQEKILYLLQGVKWRIQGTESKIKSKIKKVACKLWLDMRGHVPPSLRHFYFLEFASPAIRGYVPQVYPGRVLIFKAETRVDDPQLSWGRFVAGGLDVREVPGGHRALLNDSLVQEIVAKQLTEVLTTYWG